MAFKQYFHNIEENNQTTGFAIRKDEADNLTEKLEKSIEDIESGNLRLFDFSDIDQRVEKIEKIVDENIGNFKNLYVLGTGGATLCPQTLCGLKREKKCNERKTIFIDNIDPETINELEKDINIKDSFFLVISKSGRTTETITQFLIFLDFVKKFYLNQGTTEGEELNEKISKHFLVITTQNAENNIIEKITERRNIEILDHELVGGRFSIFSSVGLIPAKFIDIDIHKVLTGAKDSLNDLFKKRADNFSAYGAMINYLLGLRGFNSTVIMPYVDGLKDFTTWVAQIWAESLGKNDIATTPIRSLGTLDQHSQLQLYLGGRKDKFFNIIMIDNKSIGTSINIDDYQDIEDLSYLKNKKIGDVIDAATISTENTLVKKGLPVRNITLAKLTEYELGYLSMHFILETIITAGLIGVNPYDQPAVEEGKTIAKGILMSGSR